MIYGRIERRELEATCHNFVRRRYKVVNFISDMDATYSDNPYCSVCTILTHGLKVTDGPPAI